MDRKQEIVERIRVEGIDYSPDGIEVVRRELGELRGGAFKAWPEGIDATLILSHAIALLADYKEMREAEDRAKVTRTATEYGEHTASWNRSDSGGEVRVTAKWTDPPSEER